MIELKCESYRESRFKGATDREPLKYWDEFKEEWQSICNQQAIFWDDIHHYFADKGEKKHACPPSQDEKLIAMLNGLRHELDIKFDGLRQDISDQQSSTQKSIAAVRAEISNLLKSPLFKQHRCWTSD